MFQAEWRLNLQYEVGILVAAVISLIFQKMTFCFANKYIKINTAHEITFSTPLTIALPYKLFALDLLIR